MKYDGQVIRIISDEEILINVGWNIKKFANDFVDDFDIGYQIEVFTPGDEIYDLNGLFLGTIDYVKDKLIVTTLYEKMAICKKISHKKWGLNSVSNDYMVEAFQEPVSIIEKLNVLSNDIEPLRLKRDNNIKVGDYVRIIDSSY